MHFCYRSDCVQVSCLDLPKSKNPTHKNTPALGWNVCISYPLNALVKIKSLLFCILISRVVWLRGSCAADFALCLQLHTTFDILVSVLLPRLNTHSVGAIFVSLLWQDTQFFYNVNDEGKGKISIGIDRFRTRNLLQWKLWIPKPLFMNLGIRIIAIELISTTCFINSSRQFVSVCVSSLSLQGNGSVKFIPPFSASQRLDKHSPAETNTRNNRRIVGLFSY
jgi:hypothetical protein